MTTARASKLANDLASLGFYKFITDNPRNEVDAAIERGAYDWYLAAERAFDGDAERLAEGGVKDLLESMRSAFEIEGVTVPELEDVYEGARGYTLQIGADSYMLWGEGEAKRSWEQTTRRAIALINDWLAAVKSDERVHVLGGAGGHDGVFVLLTPAMQQTIANSGVFRDRDVPVAL